MEKLSAALANPALFAQLYVQATAMFAAIVLDRKEDQDAIVGPRELGFLVGFGIPTFYVWWRGA